MFAAGLITDGWYGVGAVKAYGVGHGFDLRGVVRGIVRGPLRVPGGHRGVIHRGLCDGRGSDVFRESRVVERAGTPRCVVEDRIAEARGFGELDVPPDRRTQHAAVPPRHVLVSSCIEEGIEIGDDFACERRVRLMHAEHDAGDAQVGVHRSADEAHGFEQLADALEREKMRLHRHEHFASQRERVQREQAEARRAVDQNDVVSMDDGLDFRTQCRLTIGPRGEFLFRAGEIRVRQDDVESFPRVCDDDIVGVQIGIDHQVVHRALDVVGFDAQVQRQMTLWVEVDQADAQPGPRQRRADVHGARRLAHAALLVEHGDDSRRGPARAFGIGHARQYTSGHPIDAPRRISLPNSRRTMAPLPIRDLPPETHLFMPTLQDDAVVIRRWDWSETSQTVSLFTRAHGVLRGLAKGSKREKGAFSGGMDLLTRGQIVAIVKPGRELATLAQWSLQETFRHLRLSLEANRAALYYADLVHQALSQHDPSPSAYDAFVEALRLLADHDRIGVGMVRLQWRLLVEAGYQPVLDRDVETGGPAPMTPTIAFNPRAGGVVADTGAGDRWRVRRETIEALRAITVSADAGADRNDDPMTLERANRLLAAYWREVLGHEPATMRYLFSDARGRLHRRDGWESEDTPASD